jgi:hypothetical protein
MNTKRLLTSWHLWAVVLIGGAFLFFQRSLDASILFPLAIVLLCPIMMMFMMGGKDHKH